MPTERVLYEFEGFILDPVRRLLTTQRGEAVALPPKALATLAVLVERRGQVVEKEELFQLIWPDTFITEATLTQNVFRLRKALGEEAGEHRFIVTVPGRGYSFVAEVRRTQGHYPALVRTPPPPAPPEAVPLDPLVEAPAAVDAEETASQPAAAAVPEAPRRAFRRWLPWAGTAAGCIALVAVFLVLSPFRPATSPPPPKDTVEDAVAARAQRRSIAVLGFRNLSGRKDTAWLSTALAEMFTVELGVGDRLHTITGESVTRTKRDLGLGDAENLSVETLARLRRLLGCDAILLGSYFALGTDGGDRIRVDLRLQDTASGEMLSVLTATKTEKELFDLVSALGRDLRQKLGSGPVSRTETAATRASFPVSQEATRLYSEGLQHLRSLDTLAARDLLLEATRAEPAFPLAHAALASAWATLGYDKNAEDEAARALELANTLAREDRLLVEALHAETRNNWPKAVEIYDSLWRFFPDDPEYGLRLARTEVEAGRSQEALRTVESLRRLAAPAADDPRIDLAESEAAAALSDYARQEKTAARAVEKGRSLGARLLTAQALHLQGHALRSLGRQEQALARIEEAERIFQEANDQVGVGGALHDLGNLLRDRGDFEGARERYEKALEIHRAAGNQDGIVLALTNLGGLELQRGNYVRAQSLLSDVVATAREVHDPVGEARGLSTLGSILQEQGKLVAAQRSLEEALARFRSTGSLQGEAGVRANLSTVLLDLGKLPEARDEAGKAVRLTRRIGHPRSRGYALRQMGSILLEEGKLGDAEAAFREMEELAEQTGHMQLLADAKSGLALVQRFQGRLPLARENASRALALWTESVEEQQAARGRLTLARLGLDAGELGPAEQEARAAMEQFRSLHLPDGEALAHEALAAIFLARGEPGAANREIRRAQELTVSTQNRRLKLILAIAAGRNAAAQGNAIDARRTLAAARDESAALGLRFSTLDATLALAEIDLRQSSPSARQALQSVRDEAARQGFQLVAKRAEKLLAASRPLP